MNAGDAREVIRRVQGHWPTPAMRDEEYDVWLEELTNVIQQITVSEARDAIGPFTENADRRPRIGQVIQAIKANRAAAVRRAQNELDAVERRSHDEGPFLTGAELHVKFAQLKEQLELTSRRPFSIGARISSMLAQRPLAADSDGEATEPKVCPICRLPLLPGSPLVICADCVDDEEEVDW